MKENKVLEIDIENEKLKKIIGEKTGSYNKKNKQLEQKLLEYIEQSKIIMKNLKD